MAQQQQDNAGRIRSMLTIYLIVFGGWMIYSQFFAPKPPQTAQEAGSLLSQAWGKERRVREIVLDRARKRLANERANPAAAGDAAKDEDTVKNVEAEVAAYDELYGAPAQPDTAELSDSDMKKRLEDSER